MTTLIWEENLARTIDTVDEDIGSQALSWFEDGWNYEPLDDLTDDQRMENAYKTVMTCIEYWDLEEADGYKEIYHLKMV